MGAAKQGESRNFVRTTQCCLAMLIVFNAAFNHFSYARTAGAVFTAVREVNILA